MHYMKKILLFFVILTAMGVNCFAQSQAAQVKALQGTWNLIGIMNDEESYNEQDIKKEGLEVAYIFSKNSLTINKAGEIIGPVDFSPEGAYLELSLSGGPAGSLPYFLNANILVIHEGSYAFIYRKK